MQATISSKQLALESIFLVLLPTLGTGTTIGNLASNDLYGTMIGAVFSVIIGGELALQHREARKKANHSRYHDFSDYCLPFVSLIPSIMLATWVLTRSVGAIEPRLAPAFALSLFASTLVVRQNLKRKRRDASAHDEARREALLRVASTYA